MLKWWTPDLAVFVVAGGLTALLIGVSDAAPRPAKPAPLPFLHPLFADHMVLQRDRAVPVWGWTTPDARVAVTMLGRTATGRADRDGRWEVMVGPFAAGGPYRMTVTGPHTVELADILVGDVWVCSGQSNMQMGIGQVQHAQEEIAAADQPQIRLCSVPMRIAF